MDLRLDVLREGVKAEAGDGPPLLRSCSFAPGPPVEVGRARSSASSVDAEHMLLLDDERVSRQHCTITYGPPPAGQPGPTGWWLIDAGSRSGTTVNERACSGEPVLLRAGDLLRAGRSKLRVELGSGDAIGLTCPGCLQTALAAAGPGLRHGRRWVCQDCLLGRGAHQQTIGEWVEVAELGAGSNGKVLLAAGKGGERLAALKLTVRDPFGDVQAEGEALARFRREVRILRELDHPHVVRVYSAGTTEDGYWVALELLEEDLHQVVKREGPLPLARVPELGRALLLGLAHLHALGVLHRDVKPSNVLLDAAGVVRLGDFGLCTGTGDTKLTATSMAMGTLYYTAPEQVEDAHLVDVRADLYGWGATLYHALTGTPPYGWARSFPDVLRAMLHEDLPPVGRVRPDTPAWLADLVMSALEKDPARRLASAREGLDVVAREA